MGTLQRGDKAEKAKHYLGEPDEILHTKGGDGLSPTDTWRYGVDPKSGLATLGTIVFERDKMEYAHGAYGTPPPPGIISEPELRRAMGAIYEKHEFDLYSDPLGLIRATNYLYNLGTDKTRAVLKEVSRVGGSGIEGYWLFWLAFTVFDVPSPPGFFDTPRIGALSPQPPARRTSSPRFPIILIDDVPFSVSVGLSINGLPETFGGYMDRLPRMTLVRSSPLRPPDDPFTALLKLIRSREWALIYIDYGVKIPMGDASQSLLEVLQLVRTAYPTKEGKSFLGSVDWKDFERYHQEYLKLGARWDEKLQCYVRRDGTHDKVEPLRRQK